MICELTEKDMKEAFLLAYEISQDKERNSYPIYPEPGDLQDALIGSVKDPVDQVLGCFDKEELIAVCIVFPMKEDKFLQTNGFFISGKYDIAGEQFIRYLRKKYPGYKALFGFPRENKYAAMFFYEQGAKCVESSYTCICAKERFIRAENEAKVKPLTEDRIEEYSKFHDYYAKDIYWTSERIMRQHNEWWIYVYEEKGKICGSIFMHVEADVDAEIFGVFVEEGKDVYKVTRRLLSRTLHDLFQEIPTVMDVLYFVEETSKKELQAAVETGFIRKDQYKCYELDF